MSKVDRRGMRAAALAVVVTALGASLAIAAGIQGTGAPNAVVSSHHTLADGGLINSD